MMDVVCLMDVYFLMIKQIYRFHRSFMRYIYNIYRMRFLFFVLPFFVMNGFSQTVSFDHFGASAGLILNFGTHVNSIGFSVKGYYTDYFYQINTGSSITCNLTSYGSRKKYWESRSFIGGVLLGGRKDNTIDFQLDGLTHQTIYRNGIGYNYIWYFDNSGTSQLSGGFGLMINKLSILFENDLFAGQGKDRFRTGHILITYRNRESKFGTGVYLWTGETNGSTWEKIASKKNPYGYKKLSDLPYGKTSHGILYGSVNYNLGYGQTAYFKTGIDSEQIRHIVQNRLIHDLIFLPNSVKHNTPHYPRLNSEGLPVFNKKEIRKNKFYLQTGFNENWSN